MVFSRVQTNSIRPGITVSDTTLRSRRDEWVRAGVFPQLMEDCLALYDAYIGIDLSDVSIDGSVQLAPGGGPTRTTHQVAKAARP